MQATTVGIDLAKNIFHVHGVDAAGHIVFSKPLRRAQMAEFFATLPACLIGMEACASAHFWARTLQGFGHTVRLISPQFVKPYVKSNKRGIGVRSQFRAATLRDTLVATAGCSLPGPPA